MVPGSEVRGAQAGQQAAQRGSLAQAPGSAGKSPCPARRANLGPPIADDMGGGSAAGSRGPRTVHAVTGPRAGRASPPAGALAALAGFLALRAILLLEAQGRPLRLPD